VTVKAKPPPAPRMNVELMQSIQSRYSKGEKTAPASNQPKLVALPWQTISNLQAPK